MSEKDIKNSQQYVNDSLATFLTSSLNVELVHVILDSITKHTKSFVDPNRNYLSYSDEKFKEKHTIVIDTIRIKDQEKWQVAKLGEFIVSDHADCSRRKTTQKTLVKKSVASTSTQHMQQQSLLPDVQIPMELHHSDTCDTDLIINEDVTVTEYASDCFGFLRQIDKIDFQMIKESLNTELNRDQVFKAGESQGKSGSFFFFSHDKNFIIKTMTDSDLYAFKNLFKTYFAHVSTNTQSLLARIYGIYTVKMEE